ncbi:MAG: PKD domain-containing protein [Verrucomicrobia subdivision 3 bacterium]|nr:PKD domain-containing protein [Limisphaerales bacterium]
MKRIRCLMVGPCLTRLILLGLMGQPLHLLHADCTLTNLAISPLPDLGWGSYSNFNRYFLGGLYPGGVNTRPAEHEAAGLRLALEEIQPLDTNGVPATNGQIVVLSSGMSNTTQEWASKGTNHFKGRADRDPSKNPRVMIVDGAIGGQDATRWTNINAQPWTNVLQRLASARVTTNQVQVLWLKQAIAGESGPLTNHAVQLQGHLEKIVRNAKARFPNLKLCYVSSRTRAYVYGSGLNPEPFAFETGFAVKWLIEKQINGAPELNYDPAKGPVVAPWLSWGPYVWTDGTKGRSDGFVSICPTDLENDFTHPSIEGAGKVGAQLLAFFKTDPTATPWFLRSQTIGQPPSCAPAADFTNGLVPLTFHFTANATDPDGPIRDYQWTFEDATFSTNANPVKTFASPGTYRARLTVTDFNGNTGIGVVVLNVQATFDLWRQAKFSANELTNAAISGASADPDGDRVPNELEYVLGLDPKTANTAGNGLPKASIEDGHFTLTFSRFKAAADLRLRIEVSRDLRNWSSGEGFIEELLVAEDGLTETIVARDMMPVGQADHGFLRLRILPQNGP